MWLLIDDVRSLDSVQVDLIARNPDIAKQCLKAFSNHLECVIFDHDLGDVNIDTGYDVLVWMFAANIFPPEIQLITANPVGRKNMTAAILANGYKSSPAPSHFFKL